MKSLVTLGIGSWLLLSAGTLLAQEPDKAPEPDKPPPPPPYSVPWQLRPAAVPNVVRSDTAIGFYKPDGADSGGTTIATMLLGGLNITPEFGAMLRLGLVNNSPPELPAPAVSPDSATVFLNPAVGGTYMTQLGGGFRFAGFLGVTAPIGGGGGDDPDPADVAALGAGVLTRSAMDNAMFATNYLTIFPGIDFAYVAHGLTVQAEVTLLQLMQTRGPEALENRTNLTAGLHVGYFLVPQLSLGGEIRYQTFLKHEVLEDEFRNNTTFAVGPRGHIKLGEKSWFRPGIAYARGLDKPMTDLNFNIIQVDLIFNF